MSLVLSVEVHRSTDTGIGWRTEPAMSTEDRLQAGKEQMGQTRLTQGSSQKREEAPTEGVSEKH